MMKHVLKQHQARRAGIALMVATAFAALGTGTAQAASFASANISIEPRGEAAGGLNCSFREVGLGPYASVTYSCGATDVGVLEGCVIKNKVVANSPTHLSVFKNVSNAGTEGEVEALLANNSGRINATVTAELPESAAGEGLCTEPAVATVVAVRWCNASLVDTTNNITGATVAELFQTFYSTAATVPSCAELALMPPTPTPE